MVSKIDTVLKKIDEIEKVEQKYLIKLTKEQFFKYVATFLTIVLVSTFGFGKWFQSTISDAKIAKINIEMDFLKTDIKKQTEEINRLTEEVKDQKDNVTFMIIDRAYRDSKDKYVREQTKENLKEWKRSTKTYVRYIKYKRLKKAQENAGFEYSNKIRTVNSFPVYIPQDVLINADRG